jgi:Cu(I)/Ag(I) efflux system membrane fusion protein
VRLATVTRAPLASVVEAVGVLSFNERDVAVVQARSGGFVERVYARAPGDVIGAGSPLADVLVPEWAGAQAEFLALKAGGDPALLDAARERLRLTGMPQALIERVERTGKPHTVFTVTTPIGGVIQQLDVRAGMTVMVGQTLARINGLGTVWLDVAVPEAQAGALRVGEDARASFAAFPGETIAGRITAILPEANLNTRTLRVRVELPNRDLRLKPGLTAQVRVEGNGKQTALRVPTEAVIRTGKRALVMLAEEGGRYRPAPVTLGPEIGGDTAILAGLEEGQKVVASGQFLIDSEASLKGLTARLAEPSSAMPALHESEGRIDELSPTEATLTHGPFKTLGMPGMTMAFPLARPELAQGLAAGDRVRFGVRETDDGLVIERMEKIGGKP